MAKPEQSQYESPYSEQDLSEGELVDQNQLEYVKDPPVRLAGYNQAQHLEANDNAAEQASPQSEAQMIE